MYRELLVTKPKITVTTSKDRNIFLFFTWRSLSRQSRVGILSPRSSGKSSALNFSAQLPGVCLHSQNTFPPINFKNSKNKTPQALNSWGSEMCTEMNYFPVTAKFHVYVALRLWVVGTLWSALCFQGSSIALSQDRDPDYLIARRGNNRLALTVGTCI